MRQLLLLAPLALLAACATVPAVQDKQALAREVYSLSGETEDIRAALKLASPFIGEALADAKPSEECKKRLGKDAPTFAKAACDALDLASGALKAGRAEAMKSLDAQLAKIGDNAALALADTYDVGELQAMRRYYASPEGRSIRAKRTEYWSNLARRVSGGGPSQ
jgi:hypothetical protein